LLFKIEKLPDSSTLRAFVLKLANRAVFRLGIIGKYYNMENSSLWHPWSLDLPCYHWHTTIVYLVTWDRTIPELDYSNPGYGRE
jgi:hypothetical protein